MGEHADYPYTVVYQMRWGLRAISIPGHARAGLCASPAS